MNGPLEVFGEDGTRLFDFWATESSLKINGDFLEPTDENIKLPYKVSMTQLLFHTIAHFTGPSFMLKANNQPYEIFLDLTFSWVNIVKNRKILTFKVNFPSQKLL